MGAFFEQLSVEKFFLYRGLHKFRHFCTQTLPLVGSLVIAKRLAKCVPNSKSNTSNNNKNTPKTMQCASQKPLFMRTGAACCRAFNKSCWASWAHHAKLAEMKVKPSDPLPLHPASPPSAIDRATISGEMRERKGFANFTCGNKTRIKSSLTT